MKTIELSEHFTYEKLIQYALPSIGNMLIITSFQVVDGYFVSNYLGVDAFAAISMIIPIFMVLYSFGFMFGSGTAAQISRLMGEGQYQKSKEVFSMSVASMTIFGAVLGIISTVLLPFIGSLMKMTGDTLNAGVTYGRMLTLFLAAHMINAAFQSLWITADRAWIGMTISIVIGALNVIMDWLFMASLGMGAFGAGLATSLAALIGAIITIAFFILPNNSALRFAPFSTKELNRLWEICTNGFSEMLDSISENITIIFINLQIMRFFGETGVAAYGIFGYVMAIFMAIFFGLSASMITVVGYKYGEKNTNELGSLLKKNTVLTLCTGIVMCLICLAFADPIARIYLGYDSEACMLATRVLRFSAFACLFYGFDTFIASFFTGLGDGLTSAIIAFSMSLAFPIALVYLLPAIFGENGIWFTVPGATILVAIICVFLVKIRHPKWIEEGNKQ